MIKSRLSTEKLARLMEHFVAGTTTRCAANLVGDYFKIAAYFYRRLRKIIMLDTENEALFSLENLKLIKATLKVTAKANADEAQRARF